MDERFRNQGYGGLVCYYSSEVHKKDGYNQLLCHKVSQDGGQTWGEETFDVAIPDGEARPGMAIVAPLPDGRYFMVYEIVTAGEKGAPICFRYSPDGLDWGDPQDPGIKLLSMEGYPMTSTPYVIWTPLGSDKGTLIVSAKFIGSDPELDAVSTDEYLINDNLGEGAWRRLRNPIAYTAKLGGYSRSMVYLEQGPAFLHLSSADLNDEQTVVIRYAVTAAPGQ